MRIRSYVFICIDTIFERITIKGDIQKNKWIKNYSWETGERQNRRGNTVKVVFDGCIF